eukprot:CAMPEP_0176489768 /NCGR_PEP_ID=MMETSP0200_2-20121128/7485_1 /TAXON_ID=947934 /ORGANISM="Chaetoceros sp., Strain GSL56" /LENGTH=400 /DNA_ID=CAMNT_0017886973 /DNA_START=24 /DNA_END=1226 /DNA_ORIENTATION=+
MKSKIDGSLSTGVLVLFTSSTNTTNDNNNDHGTSSSGSIPGDDNSNQVCSIGIDRTSSLNMSITDGNATFMTSVDLSKLKMTKEQLQNIDPTCWFVNTILESNRQQDMTCHTSMCNSSNNENDHPTVNDNDDNSTTCPIFSITDNDCIRLDVKYTFQTIVRVVLSVDIPRVSSSSLSLVIEISDFLSGCLSTLQTLQSQVEQVERERKEWKDTAQKLCIEQWHGEREELIQRFLVLFNKVKGDLRNANEKLNQEKQQYKVLLERYKIQEQRYGGRDDHDVMVDYEDEHDDVNLRDDDVDRLARGIRINGSPPRPLSLSSLPSSSSCKRAAVQEQGNARKKMKCTTRKHDDDDDDDGGVGTIRKANSTPTTRTRKNPLTGSIEIWNVEDMFSEEEDGDTGE